jgi:hypothetical protein
VVSVTDPYGRNLDFLERSRYFFCSSSSSTVLTRLSGPRSSLTTSQKLVALGIEPGTSGSLTARPQRRSMQTIN